MHRREPSSSNPIDLHSDRARPKAPSGSNAPPLENGCGCIPVAAYTTRRARTYLKRPRRPGRPPAVGTTVVERTRRTPNALLLNSSGHHRTCPNPAVTVPTHATTCTNPETWEPTDQADLCGHLSHWLVAGEQAAFLRTAFGSHGVSDAATTCRAGRRNPTPAKPPLPLRWPHFSRLRVRFFRTTLAGGG